MTNFDFQDAGCGPARGPKGVLVLMRRGLRRVMRPMSARLAEVLGSIVERIDGITARLDEADALYLKSLNDRAILYRKTDGLGAHLEGLTNEYRALEAHFQARVAQLESLSLSVAGINDRLEGHDDKLDAFRALHWDHVALTRRLAAIEDVLASGGESARGLIEDGRGRPLLPFPGLDESPRKVV